MAADQTGARRATVEDADAIGRLLHDFNTEYDQDSPGAAVLASRLRVLLAGDRTFALVSGEPPLAVALVTLRPNVWYQGQVALLDELYVVPDHRNEGIGSSLVALLLSTARAGAVELVEINVDEGDIDAQRFYERHGFVAQAWAGATERSFSYWQELTT